MTVTSSPPPPVPPSRGCLAETTLFPNPGHSYASAPPRDQPGEREQQRDPPPRRPPPNLFERRWILNDRDHLSAPAGPSRARQPQREHVVPAPRPQLRLRPRLGIAQED